MRLIDALELKRSISVSAITEDGKHIFDIIDEQPTIEPDRKTGKWIEKSVITKDEAEKCIEEWQSARCNQCGKYHTTPYMYYFDIYNYCPNCGADMRGDKDE